jgi:hypothetical protein
MIHAIAYIIFILPFTSWLGRELKREYSLKEHWRWLLGAFLTGIVGAMLSYVEPAKLGNFLLHASGGFASCLLYIYLFKTLRLQFSRSLTIILLFAFVSTLGVLNELAEYAFELLNLGIMSFDSHDTWRDFAANTTGAGIAWVLFLILSHFKSTDKS